MPTAPGEPLRAVLDQVRSEAGTWFPDRATGPVRIRITRTWRRPRCTLHVLQLRWSTGRTAEVVTKVRGDTARQPAPSGRPTLLPADARPLDSAAAARLEYEGLDRLAVAASGLDPGRAAAVRPLALVDGAALVMDRAAGPTLHSLVLSGLPRRHRVDDDRVGAFERTGELLRGFHGLPVPPAPIRQSSGTELVETVDRYLRFLADAAGKAPPPLPAETGDAFPRRPALVLGHGDFALRNVFAGSGRPVEVIDPLPRWQVPALEDVARLLVSCRLLGARVTTGGLVVPNPAVDRYEIAFLRGYYGSDVPRPQVLAYQLLITLDKWAALTVRYQGRGPGPQRLLARRTDRYVVSELARLAGLLRAEAHGGRRTARR